MHYTDALKALQKELKDCQKDIDSLVELVMKKPSDIFLEKIEQVEVRRDEIRARITSHELNKRASTVEAYEIMQAMEFGRQMIMNKEISTIERLVSMFVDRITIYPDKIHIKFNFAPQKCGLLSCKMRQKNIKNLGVDKSTPRSGLTTTK
jgi:hypothetical protein